MAIDTCEPVPQTRVVTATSNFQLELTERWTCKLDGTDANYKAVNPLFFVGDVEFPALGSAYPNFPALRFAGFQRYSQNSKDLYEFHGMKWSTAAPNLSQLFDQNRYDGTSNAKRSWSFEAVASPLMRADVADPTGAAKFTRPVDSLLFTEDQPVATMTGEPIIGLTFNRYVSVCQYVRNELTVPTSIITTPVVGLVNNAPITIDGVPVAARTCLLRNTSISEEKYGADNSGTPYTFRTCQYELAIDPLGWDLEVLHQGFYSLVSLPFNTGTVVSRIKVSDGYDADDLKLKQKNAATPQPLDVDGAQIITDPSVNPTWQDDVHYRIFRNARLYDFSTLNYT